MVHDSASLVVAGGRVSLPQAFALQDRLFEDVFYLTVYTSQFITGPRLQFGPEFRIHPQQERFAGGHATESGVECAGVNYRVHFGFTTKHNHQIADH